MSIKKTVLRETPLSIHLGPNEYTADDVTSYHSVSFLYTSVGGHFLSGDKAND